MRLPLLLLMLAALCVWGAYGLRMLESPAVVVAAERRPTEPPTQPAHPDTELSARNVSAAASMSLFRPATAPSALTTPEPGQSFQLVGLAGTGSSRVAFLRDEADSHTFSARVGEDVRGWRLEEVSERCVDLRRARRRVNLCL